MREKSTYLLNELSIDITLISEEQGLEDAPITRTRSLKRRIVDKFGEDVSFFPNGKYLIVHASGINPSLCSIATPQGNGKYLIVHASDINPSLYSIATPQGNGKYLIVHASDINPSLYSIATLQGYGIREFTQHLQK